MLEETLKGILIGVVTALLIIFFWMFLKVQGNPQERYDCITTYGSNKLTNVPSYCVKYFID